MDLNATAYFEEFLVGLSFCTAAGDATRATSREFIIDGHDREVVAQVVRDSAATGRARRCAWS